MKPYGISTMGSNKGEMSIHNSSYLLLPLDYKHYTSKYKKAIPVHRLDKLTSGLLLCSKTKAIEIYLKCCFENKFIMKRYRALCVGSIDLNEGSIHVDIDGKLSLTKYKVISRTKSSRFGYISTVDLWPITGRKHQL
jgi:23S rRNA-/tRNA-specific pseudouridylate synthase